MILKVLQDSIRFIINTAISGYLMFSDDWEPDGDYTRFFQPGTPARAHAFGAYPYKNPPYIPFMSHYQNDIMPYYLCCQ